MSSSNRNHSEKPALHRNDQLMVRHAMAAVVGAIPAGDRPSPDFWHDLTRDGAESRAAHLDAPIVRCRQALEASMEQGTGIHAATVHRVEVFFATLCALTLRGLEVKTSGSFADELVRAAEEHADVIVAATHAQREQSPRTVARLQKEALESIESASRIADMAAGILADPSRTLAIR